MSRAAYHTRASTRPALRALDDDALTRRIEAVHAASKSTYGAPRIHAELRRQGICCSRKRVARLMVRAGLAGRCPRRWRRTTIPDPDAEAKAVVLVHRVFGPGVELRTGGGAATSR